MKLEAREDTTRSSTRSITATIDSELMGSPETVGVSSYAGNDGEWQEARAFLPRGNPITREEWLKVRDSIDAAWVEFERRWGLPPTHKERERLRDEAYRAEFTRRCSGPANDRYFILDRGISVGGPFWSGPICSGDPLCGRIERGEIPEIQGMGGSFPPAWLDGRFFVLGSKDWVEVEPINVVVSRAHGIDRLPHAMRAHVIVTLRSLGLL